MAKKKTTAKKKKKTVKKSKVKKTKVSLEEPGDEELKKRGEGANQRMYYASVRSTADDILEDAQKQFSDYDEASDWISDRVHESADGSYWVIYTHAALDTLEASSNWLAIEDIGAELDSSNFTQAITVAAFYALKTDIEERIDSVKDDYFKERDDNPRWSSTRKRSSSASTAATRGSSRVSVSSGMKNKLLR